MVFPQQKLLSRSHLPHLYSWQAIVLSTMKSTQTAARQAKGGLHPRFTSATFITVSSSQERAPTFLIVLRILDEVVLQHPHEDGGQETGQQQHRHARVDDAEPMDLQAHAAQTEVEVCSGSAGHKQCSLTTLLSQWICRILAALKCAVHRLHQPRISPRHRHET